jgi:acetyl esterase/lipase
MEDRMPEVSEIDKLSQLLRENPIGANANGDLNKIREEFDAGAFPPADDLQIKTVDAGGVKAELITPPGADPARVIHYVHGGGYVLGSLKTHRALAGELARAAGSVALLVDYRLAPEHPHPAAIDDSVAAYRWLLSNGHAAEDVVIAGDSAGGGLTVATLLAIKQRNLPMPAAGVCISPWVDMAGTGESVKARAHLDPMVTPDMLGMMAGLYLNGADVKTPLASPIHADLKGLPPLLIQVGECEVLYSDSVMLRDRAKQAGVDVTFEEWPKMIHVWHLFHPMLKEGRDAIKKAGGFARARMGRKLAA